MRSPALTRRARASAATPREVLRRAAVAELEAELEAAAPPARGPSPSSALAPRGRRPRAFAPRACRPPLLRPPRLRRKLAAARPIRAAQLRGSGEGGGEGRRGRGGATGEGRAAERSGGGGPGRWMARSDGHFFSGDVAQRGARE